MTDSEVGRSTFAHVSTTLLPKLEATKVRLLVITLIPLVSEVSASTAYVLEPVKSRLVPRGSVDAKVRLFPLLVQVSVFEFPVVQVQVTVSPRHTDCLSQTIEVVSKIAVCNNEAYYRQKYHLPSRRNSRELFVPALILWHCTDAVGKFDWIVIFNCDTMMSPFAAISSATVWGFPTAVCLVPIGSAADSSS